MKVEARVVVDGMADDAVQRRLHRAGRNFERLDEIGADADRDDDRDQDDFDVFAPVQLPSASALCEAEERVELLDFLLDARLSRAFIAACTLSICACRSARSASLRTIAAGNESTSRAWRMSSGCV